ncbi:ABATE domain-containing protein [Streptomyces sp. NPDC048489]|uniref:CGNR zinc finger domain-containing protein n=1 Tax=Streptomyces sp. NPDC048489 TaxID=3154504 RepID=UPI003448D89F
MRESVTRQTGLPPAHGEDEHLSLALANSAVTLPGGHSVDLLTTPATANQWLAHHGLAPVDADMQEVCATRVRALREQVSSLFASRVGGLAPSPEAVTAINDAMTRVPTASLLQWDAGTEPCRRVPHPTTAIVDHALAALAADAADLITSPDAERLTSCGSTPCNRYLLRYGRRHWCSTRCGDRARAARAYARRSESPA